MSHENAPDGVAAQVDRAMAHARTVQFEHSGKKCFLEHLTDAYRHMVESGLEQMQILLTGGSTVKGALVEVEAWMRRAHYRHLPESIADVVNILQQLLQNGRVVEMLAKAREMLRAPEHPSLSRGQGHPRPARTRAMAH